MPTDSLQHTLPPSSLFGEGYNFRVVADSLLLLPTEPLLGDMSCEMLVLPQDALLVVVGREELAVTDSTTQVWVRVASEDEVIGWVPEQQLIRAVVPDNPMSMGIRAMDLWYRSAFLWSTLAILALLVVVRLCRVRPRVLHVSFIPSLYPTLACICVAVSATQLTYMQHAVPGMLQQFYYEPSFSPFGQPYFMGLFIGCMWLVALLAIATIDDVLRLFPFGHALLTLLSVLAVCMVLCLVITAVSPVTGAILTAVYTIAAVGRYVLHSRPTCLCGNCGRPMHRHDDVCPWCGVRNQ